MKKKYFLLLLVLFLNVFFPLKSFAFTKIADFVFGGMSVSVEELDQLGTTIQENKKANKKIKDPRKKLPIKIEVVEARQANPTNIQLEIDTSEVLLKSQKDVQLPISNIGFLNAIQEALQLFESIDIANIKFAPLKFTSTKIDTEDGKNTITFRPIETPPEGVSGRAAVFTIVNFARGENVTFMNQNIMVKPGTILDADVIFDPQNDPCLAYIITSGDFKIGGDDNAMIIEGGADSNELQFGTCKKDLSVADITDFAVRGISRVLGLETSAIFTAATSRVPLGMVRYKFTNDDRIGFANLYPNPIALENSGAITGKVLVNDKPIIGAHIVLEDVTTGEPIAGTLTDFKGEFEMKAIPEGTYTVYAESLDGRVRPSDFSFNSFGQLGGANFTTAVFPEPVTITAKKTTHIQNVFKDHPGSAFNINTQVIAPLLTENDAITGGLGVTPLPLKIRPGETISNVKFWGDNITTNFGTLSISGTGITVSNVMDAQVPISPFIECAECKDPTDPNAAPCRRSPLCAPTEELITQADQIPGITADITCDAGVSPGPRTIIFTGDKLDSSHPSFGLRDQLTGSIIVQEE